MNTNQHSHDIERAKVDIKFEEEEKTILVNTYTLIDFKYIPYMYIISPKAHP